jgi:hypothetical protein
MFGGDNETTSNLCGDIRQQAADFVTRSLSVGAAVMFSFLRAFAQSPSGFVYAAGGGELTRSSGHSYGHGFLHFGGGGEYVTTRGFGVAADVGLLTGVFGGTTGTLSVDGTYHFRRERPVELFVAGGYSLFFSQSASFVQEVFQMPANNSHLNLFNVGGGINLWFSRHLGATVEIRDHVHTGSGATAQYAEFMLGLGFR